MTTASWGPHRGVPWSKGRWSAELRGDEIADIRYEGRVVVRSIRGVSRDPDWGTVPVSVVSPPPIQDRGADDEPGGTTVLRLRYDGLGVTAEAHLQLRADGDRFTVTFECQASRTFDTNRTGLVLLHPPHLAGSPLGIVHGDGSTEHTKFPRRIRAHQPALDIAALRWSSEGVDLTARFAGDVFEMEDQRNWTDASFKTYSRPLSRPFPYRLEAGEIILQHIVLTAEPTPATPTSASTVFGRDNCVRLVDAGRRAPSIGIGAPPSTSTDVASLPPADFVLVEVAGDDPDPGSVLSRAAASGLPLDIRFIVDTSDQVAGLVSEAAPFLPIRLAVFSSGSHVSEPDLWHPLERAARELGLEAELLGGARSHFTELNRTHHRLPEFPSWTISITPQMHARDTFQLEESIGMQRRVATDAIEIAGGRALHVGPVTLRPRFNAVRTTSAAEHTTPDLDSDTVDARQAEPQLGSWVIASAAALAEGGAASITWFETIGPRGLVAEDGTPLPVRDAVAAVHAMSGEPLLVPAEISPDDSMTWLVGVRTSDGARVLVARLGDTTDDVVIEVDGCEESVSLEPGTWKVVDLRIPTQDRYRKGRPWPDDDDDDQ